MNNYQKIFVIIMAIAIAAFLLLFSWFETKVVLGQTPKNLSNRWKNRKKPI